MLSSCSKLEFIKIPENSNLKSIENGAFDSTKIKSFHIPASLSNLGDDWCSNISELKNVTTSPNNLIFKLIDNGQLLISKSSINNENYDVINFASRSIQNIKIPSFITTINSSAFFNCTQLKKVEFTEDSEIECIGYNAFASSGIKTISIPKNIADIEFGAFHNCNSLTSLEILCDYIYSPSNLFDVSGQSMIYSFPNITKIKIDDDDISEGIILI